MRLVIKDFRIIETEKNEIESIDYYLYDGKIKRFSDFSFWRKRWCEIVFPGGTLKK